MVKSLERRCYLIVDGLAAGGCPQLAEGRDFHTGRRALHQKILPDGHASFTGVVDSDSNLSSGSAGDATAGVGALLVLSAVLV